MRPILLIMWTAFESFILRDNNNNNNNNGNDLEYPRSLALTQYSATFPALCGDRVIIIIE